MFIIEAIDLDGLTKTVWNKASHPENRLPYVIDPACGSGAFLLHAMNRITNTIKSNSGRLVSDFEEKQFYNARMSDEMPNYWAENFIYGFDPKFIMAITSKVNMVLHGDGSAHMFKYDAFKPFSSYNDTKLRICNESERSIPTSHYPYDLCETFDVVLSNPPFGVTLSPDTRRTLGKTFSLSDKLPSDALFIERAFQLLKPKGRLGIVLPESIFNASDLMPVRLFLYKMFKIKAIVALPRNAFIDTPTLTSLLFAEKKSGAEISAWDKDWAESENHANEQVKKAKLLVSQWTADSIQELQDRIFTLLSGIVDERDWSYKKGKNAEILEMKPKYSFPSIEEAREHYLSIFKSASFEKHVQRFIFNKVAKIHNNIHHTYMVDEVGYKLSKRKEKPRPNQLITFLSSKGENIQNLHLCESEYFIKYDTNYPNTILDFIKRDVKWGA